MEANLQIIQCYEANYPEMLHRAIVINGTCIKQNAKCIFTKILLLIFFFLNKNKLPEFSQFSGLSLDLFCMKRRPTKSASSVPTGNNGKLPF